MRAKENILLTISVGSLENKEGEDKVEIIDESIFVVRE